VRGDFWSSMSRGVSGVAQSLDSRRVALPSSTLNVMRALCWPDTTRCKRDVTTFVRAESPPTGRRYVYRSTNKRMTKAKAAGYVSFTNHVEAKQLVDGVERRDRFDRRSGRRELKVEGIASDGGTA
jgi:hypothetical protein